MSQRVIVTGGSGKLGRACVADLVEHGYLVVNADRTPPPVDQGCPYLQVDLTDYGQVTQMLTSVQDRYDHVDAVVHLGAIPAPGLVPDSVVFTNNTVSTYNVFSAAVAAGITNVVWASSETVLGLPFDIDPPYLPIDEEYPGRPETSYALSKLVGEQMAAQFCRRFPALKICALRFSNVMEPARYAQFPGFQDDPLLRKWNAWGYIDADDGAQAIRLALQSDMTGFEIFIIANADTCMERSSADLAAEVFPHVPVRHQLGEHETLLSIDKAVRLLGYAPQHPWRERLAELHAYEADQPLDI